MIGRTISHYNIVGKLGEGGMGLVFRARDLKLDRTVALKFLSRQSIGPGAPDSDLSHARDLLLREARAASALNHPNICTVHDINEEGEEFFIVMECVEGETLRERLRPPLAPFPGVKEILDVALQIASGLKAAHDKGVVHGDIKPENIIVTPDGRVKIMDFGIARFQRSAGGTPKEGRIAGSTSYMSPEQIEGLDIGPSSDIFSLGVVLYEQCSGRPPFAGDYELAVLYSILHAEPAPPAELDPSIPVPLSRVILKCLSKRASERYRTCEELMSDLRPLLELSSTAAARPASPLLPEQEEGREHFVARESQLTALREFVGRAAEGRGYTLFIGGESGIGKSRLVGRSLAGGGEARLNVLWGRCLFRESGLPYHPFAAALKATIPEADDRVMDILVRRAAGLGFNLAVRQGLLRAFLNQSSESAALLNKEQLWAAILVLFTVIASDTPTVLVIDDLQWADPASVSLFAFLARNITTLPMLQIGIVRPGDRSGSPDPFRGSDDGALPETIRQLKIEGFAGEIDLPRFTAGETALAVEKLLEGGKSEPEIARAVFEKTQGNPLFIFELVSLMRSEGLIRFDGTVWRLGSDAGTAALPERVHDIILQRLGGLDARDREILEVASCEGDFFQSDVLASCLKGDRLEFLKRLQALEKTHHLIRHDKNRYRFDHPLIRQVLYGSILDELREEYHSMIAGWMIERYGGRDEYASRIAHHLLSSGRRVDALGYLVRAGKLARELYAVEEALGYYRRAAEIMAEAPSAALPFGAAIEEGLGDVCCMLGRSEESLRHYAALLERVRASGERPREAVALRKSVEPLRILGRTGEAIERAEAAVSLAAEFGSPGERIQAMNALSFIYSSRSADFERAICLAEDALQLGTSESDPKSRAVSLSNLGFAYLHRGDLRRAAAYFEEARALQRLIGDQRGLSVSLNYLGLTSHRFGRFEDAIRCFEESVGIKRSIADHAAIPGGLNGLADTYRDMFQIDQAIALHLESLELARRQQNRGAECDNLRDLGADHLLTGRHETALRYLEEGLTLSKSTGHLWYETRSYISLGELHLAMAGAGQAEHFSKLGLQYARTLNASELIVEAILGRARVLAGAGAPRESADLLREGILIAGKAGHTVLTWQAFIDLAGAYEKLGLRDEEAGARGEAARIIRPIIDHFRDPKLKETFMRSEKVRESAGTGLS